MIFSFSGIGGSGKTTQIAQLVSVLKDRHENVAVFALREEFLWPRLVSAVRKPREGGGSGSGEKRSGSLAKHVLRSVFYLGDFWRIYLFKILPASRRGPVIVDRYWHDFVVELALDRGRLGFFAWLLRLAPKPQVAFWFTLPPEVAMQRKYEVDLPELERHVAMYEQVFGRLPFLAVDAGAGPDKVQALLRYVTFAAATRRDFCSKAVLLFSEPGLLRALGKASWRPFVRHAGRNRAQHLAFQLLEATPEAKQVFADAYATVRTRATLRAAAEELLVAFTAETGEGVAITKGEHAIELGSDVDVVFASRDAMGRFTSWAEGRGARIEGVDADKADIFFRGALPIDAHVGMTFSGFSYLSPKDFFDHPREAEALTVIAHAANELTVIAAGDLLKIRALGNLDSDVMRRIAREHGWSSLLGYWNRHSDPARLGYLLPHAIPAWRLAAWRVRRWLHRTDGNPFADFLMLAKGIRARLMGHIPYHEPWYGA